MFFILNSSVYGETVPNTSSQCVDVLLLFARGSSQNPEKLGLSNPYEKPFSDNEREASVFFQTFKAHLDRDYPKVKYKAHSVHDFPNIGNSVGYLAVPAFSWPFANPAEGELSWVAAGDYRSSLRSGADETAWFIKKQVQDCPDQKIVLGGYSQGAQVAGDSLFQLSGQEREAIGGVALFGDPKFLASDFSPRNPFKKTTTYPWKRGTATVRDTGMLDPRDPYVPPDMARKVFSWCFRDDFICAGNSGIRIGQDFLAKLGAGHTRYAGFGVQQAATEIIQNMAPQLYAIDKSRGGVDKDKGAVQPVPHRPSSKPIDFMFLVNFSAGHDDALGQLRFATPYVLPVFSSYFGDIRYGVGDFGERWDQDNSPRINFHQDLKPLLSTSDPTSQISNTFWRKLAYGSVSGGGGDMPEPHILAIERMAMEPSWRSDAKKHMVIISNRPLKEPYTYNMCNSNVRIGFGLNFNNCLTQPSLEFADPKHHPEYCKDAFEVLYRSECALGIVQPTGVSNKSRTIQDAVRIANSKGIAVSIVVPHAWPRGIDEEAARKQLENLAKSTGGLFIKYDVFSQASYSDMMWRVLNHDPLLLRISDYDTVDAVEQWGNAAPAPQGTLQVRERLATLLDVSQSTQTFQEYKWDFDSDGRWDAQTGAPNVEHVFSLADSGGFVTVMAVAEDGQSATGSFPVLVQPYGGETEEALTIPDAPAGVKAVLSEGRVEISWDNRGESEVMFVGDAATGMPIVSAPAKNGKVAIPFDEDLDMQVQVWVMNTDGFSERLTVAIQVPVNEPGQNIEVPKEKRGLGESNPWWQLRDVIEQNLQAIVAALPAVHAEQHLGRSEESAEPDAEPQVAAATTAAGDESAAEQQPSSETADTQPAAKAYDYKYVYAFSGTGLAFLLILGWSIIFRP